ncbi:hypothetical protein ACGFIF_11975 [Kribbella sp. NPDC049174]|uniref:hypothetical protein n=1 Tax=Kribbella sp. NPDC049174 TaxID=3364112 RepID=UPI003717AC58
MSETIRPSGADGPEPGAARSWSRSVRSWGVYLTTMTGLLCVIAIWGVGGALTAVVVIGATTALIASSVWAADGRRAVPKIARVTLATSLMAPAAAGLIAVTKFAGVLVVLLLAATSPALTSLVRSRRPTQGDAPAAPPPVRRVPTTSFADGSAEAPARELSSLDDEALCLAWRRSFVLLEDARSAMARLSVVEQRQRYLDELDRRSPEGLAAWLASGARASGNPLPYVDDARRRAG